MFKTLLLYKQGKELNSVYLLYHYRSKAEREIKQGKQSINFCVTELQQLHAYGYYYPLIALVQSHNHC